MVVLIKCIRLIILLCYGFLLNNALPTTEGLREALEQLQLVVPKYAALIIDRVSHQCIQCLETAQTIPRLYRRTNREVG